MSSDATSLHSGNPGSGPRAQSRARRIAKLVTTFFVGQGALQVLNMLVGFYLVHALSIEQYAQYGLTASFQQTAALLMDLGFASTIIPLIGQRANDRALVGRYVRSAKYLRDRICLVLAPFAVAGLLAIMHPHHWSWVAQTALVLSMLLAIYSSGKGAYFAPPLYLHGLLKECYTPQAVTGIARLVAVVALRTAGALNGWVATLVNALSGFAAGELLQKRALREMEWPHANDPQTNREVFRYILPAIPAMIFAAFQVQSAVLLIGIFGQTTGIAQVSALGRLSQLFGILTIFNAVIVEPFMAKSQTGQVGSRYLLLLALAALACAPLVAFAFVEPGLTLRLLGSKYEGLNRVVGWAVLAGALNYIQVLMWIMNRSRKWVFWRGTLLEIGLTLIVEILYISLHGVSTTADAVFFSIVAAVGPLATHLYIAIYGFSRAGSRVPAADVHP